jgi:hypothetical protein
MERWTCSAEPSSGPTVDMSPGVAESIRRANLVAITYSSRWPLIARPTSSSLVIGPYSCAVSRKTIPSSSARWMVAVASTSSTDP